MTISDLSLLKFRRDTSAAYADMIASVWLPAICGSMESRNAGIHGRQLMSFLIRLTTADPARPCDMGAVYRLLLEITSGDALSRSSGPSDGDPIADAAARWLQATQRSAATDPAAFLEAHLRLAAPEAARCWPG